MGSSQSVQLIEEEEAEEEEEEGDEEEEETEEAAEGIGGSNSNGRGLEKPVVKKVLEQEPEILPCHASASPLSPQLSSLGTPRLGPSIKVWDPYNLLLAPPPPPPPPFYRFDDDRSLTFVYLISHGDCDLNLRPDLVAGRCHAAALTPTGKRQARALAVFFKSQGLRFTSVYSSPLDRARSTALSVCQEMNFPEEHIQSSDALAEMSLGDWEGCHRSEIYTPEIASMIEQCQPDFLAPSGESLRQVEYRMVEFLNGTVIGLTEKLRSGFSSTHQSEAHSVATSPHWDLLHRHRPSLSRKKSGKSRLKVMTHEAEDEMSPREVNNHNDLGDINMRSSTCVGIFTHSLPIKCLLTGLMGCSPVMCHKMCVEDSSVTVLQHSWRSGWQIKRLNDTAHLRLL